MSLSAVEDVLSILHKSSRRWISALKAEELLRDMAATFGTPLERCLTTDLSDGDADFNVPWVRMVPRIGNATRLNNKLGRTQIEQSVYGNQRDSLSADCFT
jgi:hypothetical protein